MAESIPLSTGRLCTLEDPRLPLLSHYRVLSFPTDQGQPSREEADEMLLIATRKGRDLARYLYADEECFSLIFNAGRTRRRPWHHVHILLASPDPRII